jgi:hypothetical protein
MLYKYTRISEANVDRAKLVTYFTRIKAQRATLHALNKSVKPLIKAIGNIGDTYYTQFHDVLKREVKIYRNAVKEQFQ